MDHIEHRHSWLHNIHHILMCGAVVAIGYYFFTDTGSLADYRLYLAFLTCCLIHFAFHKLRHRLLEKVMRE